MITGRANLDLEALLHQPAFLAFNAQNGIHGQIERIARSGSETRLTHYSLTLVPSLAYLAHRTQHRIFQHLTVQQIIEQVLEEHGIFSDGYTFAGFSDYPPREYCVQYGESDLHFIQRLCFEEGFHYYFRHSPDSHQLVFGDKQQAFTPLKWPTPYVPGSGMVAEEPAITQFEMSLRALERHQAESCVVRGKSDQPSLLSGHFFILSDHPLAECNVQWLLTHITLEGCQPQVLEAFASASTFDFQGYRNSFDGTLEIGTYRAQKTYAKSRTSTQPAGFIGLKLSLNPQQQAYLNEEINRLRSGIKGGYGEGNAAPTLFKRGWLPLGLMLWQAWGAWDKQVGNKGSRPSSCLGSK